MSTASLFIDVMLFACSFGPVSHYHMLECSGGIALLPRFEDNG